MPVNNIHKKNDTSTRRRHHTSQKTQNNTPLSVNNLLSDFKIITLKNVINKFNKLYTLCKSKKIDKFHKNMVISHRLNTIIKKRIISSLQRNYKKKINKYKRKIRKKGNENTCDRIQETVIDEDTVRNKIREQLNLLRNFKRIPPLITLKSKVNSKPESPITFDNIKISNKLEINKPISPKPSTSFGKYENNNKVENFLNNLSSNDKTFEDNNNDPKPLNMDNSLIDETFDYSSFSLIKPTKTNDITKIKGWRGKQFLKTNSELTNNIENKTIDDRSMDIPELSEISTKSAFESEALDKFLTNAKLNISYEVPKLIAEEAISKIDDSKVMSSHNANNHIVKPIIKNSDKKCKAKTLAEKRKMIENDRQKDLLHEMEINETTLLKQLKRDEKRHRIETINEIRNTLRNQLIPISRECWKTVMKSENNQSVSQVIACGNESIQITGSYGDTSIRLTENKIKRDENKYFYYQNVQIIDEISFKEIRPNYKTMFSDSCKYKPGPLSKKPFLDNYKTTIWETVVISLPQIILEVHSECGKEMNPKILPYLQTEVSETGFISDMWANFAASAVIRDNKNIFDFPLKYTNNQHKILMKRKKIAKKSIDINHEKNAEKLYETVVDKCSIYSEVEAVINDILKYLDTPVLDNSNIDYCPNCPKFEEPEQPFTPITQVSDDVHAIISTSRKRKISNLLKTERELKRLSVQVIEVDMQSETKVKRIKNETCLKEECRKGCVCYDSDVEWPQHCGREACMLQCQCRSIKMIDKQHGHQYITLPEGSNILSAKTMGHIRDQAHKNLAKEERKFTQTVIKANDQTIVVGEGCRERRKRVKKVPQKYAESIKNCTELKKIHIEGDNILEQPTNETPKRSIRIWGNEKKLKEDLIDVPNLKPNSSSKPPVVLKQEIVPMLENMVQLKNVLPWCMVHHLYKCFCNGYALEDSLAQKSKKVIAEKEEVNDEDYIAYTSKRTYAAANPFANSEINVCARIRGVPNFYLNRNKSQYFKTRNIEIYEKEKENNYFHFIKTNDNNDDVVEIAQYSPAFELIYPDSSSSKNKSHKLTEENEKAKEVLNDNDTELKVSENSRSIRRKTLSKKYSSNQFIANFTKIPVKEKPLLQKRKISLRSISTDNKMMKKEKKVIKSSFTKEPFLEQIPQANCEEQPSSNKLALPQDTSVLPENWMLPDLLIPMPHIQSHFRSMVFKVTSSKHVFRLMQWEKLNEHFHNSSLFIWYNPKGVGGKLIATKLKTDRPSEDYIDVKYFKNMTTELPDVVKGLIQGKLPGRTFDSKNTYGIFVFTGVSWEIRGTILKKPTDSPIIREAESKEKSPDVQNKIKELHLESKEVPLTIAEPELHVDSNSSNTPASIRVPIPIGTKDSRWFMLILENDFSVLRVANSPVHVKYAQLKQACQFAMRVARTVRFLIPRNNKHGDNTHPAYGGYAVPGLLERVFFGPYDLVEGHGIMTYRYLNGKLVDTKLVDRLTGSESKKSKGIWLYTKGGDPIAGINTQIQDGNDIPIVDLTENDDAENEMMDQQWDSINANKPKIVIPEMNIEKLSPTTDPLDINSVNISVPTKTYSRLPNSSSPNNNPQKKNYNNTLSCKPSKYQSSVPNNKVDASMPVLEKIDSKVNVGKTNKEMPTLQPIAFPPNKYNTPVESNSKEASTTNPLPIYYTSRRNPVIKRKRKSQLQEICNDDDLEIISSTISTKPKERKMWLVSEPKNLGYIEIKTYVNGKIGLKSPINKQEIEFNEMSAAIDWIDKLLRRFVHFVPIDFQIRMFLIEDEKALMNRQPLKEIELRGHHVICKKGLFDLTELTSNDIDDLGISIRERDKLLQRQPTLILQKYIYKLGDTFLPVETMRSMLHETIINMTSPAIRRLQKENIRLKKEKRDCLLENQRLQKTLRELSKSINLKHNGTNKIGVDREETEDDDDDVIIIEEDDDKVSNKDFIEKDPLELPEDTNLVISNVTSLADNYVDNNDFPLLEPINSSCKIVQGKIKQIAEPLSKLIPNSKKPTANTQSKNSIVDTNKSSTTSSDNTKSPVYAPVVLPDGRSILIPIEPSNTNTKLVVSDNQSKKYKIQITPMPSRKKHVSLLNNKLKSNSQQNSTITAPSLKSLSTKSVNSQSILKNKSKKFDSSSMDDTPITISEVIEID